MFGASWKRFHCFGKRSQCLIRYILLLINIFHQSISIIIEPLALPLNYVFQTQLFQKVLFSLNPVSHSFLLGLVFNFNIRDYGFATRNLLMRVEMKAKGFFFLAVSLASKIYIFIFCVLLTFLFLFFGWMNRYFLQTLSWLFVIMVFLIRWYFNLLTILVSRILSSLLIDLYRIKGFDFMKWKVVKLFLDPSFDSWKWKILARRTDRRILVGFQ